jgi:hypothetical protein
MKREINKCEKKHGTKDSSGQKQRVNSSVRKISKKKNLRTYVNLAQKNFAW